MDLVSSIRKSGSRGGVNFSWDEVKDSTHRENYLGHSLMAPVGRWAKGRDLNWYAKADATGAQSDETEEERAARQRKDEIRKIKEAEEDAMARALGLPPPVRNTTGANSIEVGEGRASRLDGDSATGNVKDASSSRGRPGRAEQRGVNRERQHRHGHRSRSRESRQDRSPRRREETKDRRLREDRDLARYRRERSRDRGGEQRRHKRNRSRSRSRSRQRDAYRRRRSRSKERKLEGPTKRERDSRSPPLRKRRSSSSDHHRRRTYN